MMGPCTAREKAEEYYYICDQCLRVSPRPPAVIVRVWRREWHLCSHECWVRHLRGY